MRARFSGKIGLVREQLFPISSCSKYTDLSSHLKFMEAVLPYFRERTSGYVIQISSIGGRVGPTGRAAYAAAKFGVEG